MKSDTCPKCGAATDTDALWFVHAWWHRLGWPCTWQLLPEIAELMQEYADWCFAEMDGSADDSSEE